MLSVCESRCGNRLDGDFSLKLGDDWVDDDEFIITACGCECNECAAASASIKVISNNVANHWRSTTTDENKNVSCLSRK